VCWPAWNLCQSFRVHPNREKRELQWVARQRKCLQLYFYRIDRDFGLMHLRLPTWLPLRLQVCVNGREWLARQMQRAGIKYQQQDNCFTSIADPEGAQRLMDRLGEYPWARWLNRWAEWVNPWLGPRARPRLRGYYWMVRWYALRKGMVDLRRRLQLRRAANARYLEALAVVGEECPAHRILDPVSQPLKEPRRYRALRPISPEDSPWFGVLLRGEFRLQGVRNQDLRKHLLPEPASDSSQGRKAAARVTRQLRLLRAHRLIYREGRTYSYRPTQKGYTVMSIALKFRQTDFAPLAA